MVMKAAEDGRRYDAAHVLDRAIDRSVLVERPMGPQPIIISGILRQYPAQVRFAQNNHMVDALASDRTDQPFGEAVLPRRARGDSSLVREGLFLFFAACSSVKCLSQGKIRP